MDTKVFSPKCAFMLFYIDFLLEALQGAEGSVTVSLVSNIFA